MPISQENSKLAIATPLGEDVLIVVHATISEQLGRLFSMDLELSSEDPALDFSAIVGGNATLRLEIDEQKTRFFNGFVSRFVQTEADSRVGGRYRATLVPWLWFLTRTADCRIFQNLTVPDIIKQVFRDHGFTDFRDLLSNGYGPWENCVQYRETDFNFVSRLMEHEGIYYFFEHENGKHVLVLADSVSAHLPYPDYETINFRTARGGVADSEAISSWTLEQEVQPGAYSLNDFNFEKPKTSLLARSQINTSGAQSNFEVYDYPGEYGEQSDGSDYSKLRIEELHTQYEVVHGAGNARGIAAGFLFTLANSPRRDQNREYLVTSATYQLTGETFGSGGDGGASLYQCQFTAIDSARPFRSARITPKPLIQGPQTAIVVGPKGEEIHTDQYGRVVVQFHWDRYGKADENSSCWVRISQAAWAGKKWGSIHLPRVGQEVIVEFLEGDPDLPIVTGRVYNADAMPPYDLPAHKTMSTLKSSSSKGGAGFNELRFEDKKGHEQVFLHAERNLDTRVKANSLEYVGYERHLIVESDQCEKVNGDKHQEVAGYHLQKAGEFLYLESEGNIDMKAGANWIVDAEGDVSILSASGIAILCNQGIHLKSGDNFITITPSGIKIQGTLVDINGGGPCGGTVYTLEHSQLKSAQYAANAKPGETSDVAATPARTMPTTYGPTAVGLMRGAQSGTPFCKRCAEAAGQTVSRRGASNNGTSPASS